jgi:general stress protein 26
MSSNVPGWEPTRIARQILAENRVAVIATSVDDEPWASTVFYAERELTLYVNTPNSTRMLRNLLANPRVSFAIDERKPTYFLQGAGRASIVDDPGEIARAKSLLAVKVPEAHVGAPGYTLVRIQPTTLSVSDFRGGYRPRADIVVERTLRSVEEGKEAE